MRENAQNWLDKMTSAGTSSHSVGGIPSAGTSADFVGELPKVVETHMQTTKQDLTARIVIENGIASLEASIKWAQSDLDRMETQRAKRLSEIALNRSELEKLKAIQKAFEYDEMRDKQE